MADDGQLIGAAGGAMQGAATGAAFGPVGIAAGAVLGGLAGALGSSSSKAKKLAEAQARMIERTAEENNRRAQKEADFVVGGAQAQVYASNLMMSGSPKEYTTELKSQFQRDMAWDMAKAKMEARQVRAGGKLAASQIKSGAISSLMGGMGSLADSGLLDGLKKGP